METVTDLKVETTEHHAIIEFHAVTIAVREDIGSFKVGVLRHGNLQNIARVRYGQIDPTEDTITLSNFMESVLLKLRLTYILVK